MALVEGMTPDQFVTTEEGTYDPLFETFCCTDCYVRLGCPSTPQGWKAPKPNWDTALGPIPGEGSSNLQEDPPSSWRELPCPSCGEPCKLSAEDVKRRRQCDDCASLDEAGLSSW